MCVKDYIGRDKRFFLLSNSYCKFRVFPLRLYRGVCFYYFLQSDTYFAPQSRHILVGVNHFQRINVFCSVLFFLCHVLGLRKLAVSYKKWFLTCYGFPSSISYQTVHSSSSSSIWFPIFACICECVCAVYELLAIKYNYTLNPLDFFFLVSNHTRSLSSCTFSPRKRKKFDYKTNRFLCLLLLLRVIFSH